MQKTSPKTLVAVAVVVLLLSPVASARDTREGDRLIDLKKIVKRIVMKIRSLDEMLTPPKP